MDQKLISICIPTYNRDRFLEECLQSITKQFSNPEIKNKVNIFILDNQSVDNTKKVSQKFIADFNNIQYLRDDKNRKIAPGIIKAASLADGQYVWILSDDEILKDNCLIKIIEQIEKHGTDFILCNIDSFTNGLEIRKKNLLNIKETKYLQTRKELFCILNNKFYDAVDYYTTLCSNWLLKKEFIEKTKDIYNIYNDPKLDLFPFPSLLFYSKENFSTTIISDSLILFRIDNTSWGHKNPIKHFMLEIKLLKHHYNNIVKNNTELLPQGFKKKVILKNIRKMSKGFIKVLIAAFLKEIGLYEKLRKIIKK